MRSHANAMARRLADGDQRVPGVRLRYPVESNAVFAALDPARIEALQREWNFHVWDEGEHVVRWMTAFDTTEDDVDVFAGRGSARQRAARSVEPASAARTGGAWPPRCRAASRVTCFT